MLHKAEEWMVSSHAPKIKMMKEHGRHLRLDDEAERKLITGALACNWRPRTLELFRDIVILMRDTGMRNERELFRMRIENLDWQDRVIFVPDGKTAEGRRLVPMSGRVVEILRNRCDARQDGWVFTSKRSASGHLMSICNLFRKARNKASLPKELVLYCARHDYGTRVLMRTGNLAAVMRTMGHRDVKTAMRTKNSLTASGRDVTWETALPSRLEMACSPMDRVEYGTSDWLKMCRGTSRHPTPPSISNDP
jgi:integrase